MDIATIFLQSTIKRVTDYKELGDKTLMLLNELDFHFTPNVESNSIAIIIQHLSGNMKSRWTHFLTADGEKEFRNRDAEFKDQNFCAEELINLWNTGWDCFLNALQQLKPQDLLKTIYIRHEGLSVIDAINRQLTHYPYHVGQIIYVAKLLKDKNWQSLSISKSNSQQYNDAIFLKNSKPNR